MSARQFESFRASALFCKRCARSVSVREKLLLILPDKELYDYLCTVCGDSIGSREVSATEKLIKEAAKSRRNAPSASRGMQVRIL